MRRLVAFLALALPAAAASAQLVEEVRLGVLQHNVCMLDCDNANREQGPDINGEIVFASPDFLAVIGGPRPYVVASANLGGDTSFGAAGLHWNWKFADGWSLEPGLSYVIHDGELSVPFPQGDPRNALVSRSKVFLGSRDLFRANFALNRDFGDKWGIQVMHEHLSHGQILGNGRNQGIDNASVRVIYRLSE
jgi:lipid A 3-O-deacylase